jgi:hypothetical protein
MVLPLCGGLNWNSVIPSVNKPSYQPKYLFWGGRGGFPKNLVTQVSIKRLLISLIFVIIFNLFNPSSNAMTKAQLKELARQYIGNEYQYQCYDWLITKESNWRTNARNGSHYGIGQMRNIKVLKLTPEKQLQWHLKYIGARYGYVIMDGRMVFNICGGAYRHFMKKGWH